MLLATHQESWSQFLDAIQSRTTKAAFGNWLSPIRVLETEESEALVLEVPNIFVKEYLLSHYKKELIAFVPVDSRGEPMIEFVVAAPRKLAPPFSPVPLKPEAEKEKTSPYELKLNPNYRFDTFIEGPANQFVKSAAMGVASRPGQSYNPLFIHGGVGLGKTHILHSIGHFIREFNKKLKVHCITTEAFINELVDSLRNKSIDKMKRFYRSEVDVLLVDDIQFLQNRLNFEEELTNTFETLLNGHKQIVITCDKPPAQLKLSERMSARLECGLVAHIGVPELETRVAILQHKAEQRGIEIPHKVAFYIAEHIYNNVRQLEGAINRLSAHSRLLNLNITEELVEKTLKEMLQSSPKKRITIEEILKCVATIFEVKVSELKGSMRTKEIALARQVAMYLAKILFEGSLALIGESFGKTHSTILHACKAVEKKLESDDHLRCQVQLCKRNIAQ